MFHAHNQKMGDILLVQNKSKKSLLNRIAQGLGTGKIKPVKYSHVILCLSNGIYIEAMKYKKNNQKFGIDFLSIKELKKRFKSEYDPNWKVIRNTTLTKDQQSKIYEKSMYFFGQRYNNNFIVKKTNKGSYHGSSYCSELVSRIYQDIGITFNASEVWPADIDTISEENDWVDITWEYSNDSEISDDIKAVFNDDSFENWCQLIRSANIDLLKTNCNIRQEVNIQSDVKEWIKFASDEDKSTLYRQLREKIEFYNIFILPFMLKKPKPNSGDEFNSSWITKGMTASNYLETYNHNLKASNEHIDITIVTCVTQVKALTDIINITPCMENSSIDLTGRWYQILSNILKPITTYSQEDLNQSQASLIKIPSKHEKKFGLEKKLTFLIEQIRLLSQIKEHIEPMVREKEDIGKIQLSIRQICNQKKS